MKYIMFHATIGSITKRVPVIFSEDIIHSDIANAVAQAIGMSLNTPRVKIVSAGFIDLEVDETYGVSETLKMKSNPEDAEYINYPPLHKIVQD